MKEPKGENMNMYGRGLLFASAVLAVLGGIVDNAQASVMVTGFADPQYLISGAPATLAEKAVLKIVFENKTSGTNVMLCAGTLDDFVQGKCSIRLSDSGGPGFQFLTIIDARELSGKVLYAIRGVGTAPAQFTLTIE
jgi:hypothetical protein